MPGSSRCTSAPSDTKSRRALCTNIQTVLMCSPQILLCDFAISDVVGAGGNAAAAARPVGVEELAARFVHALVGVRAEVVALGLQQIRRQPLVR